MLRLVVPAAEQWDEVKQEFVYSKEYTLYLEHSLVSLSKWESKWCMAFLHAKELTYEQSIDYIRCMTTTQNVPYEVYTRLTNQHILEVRKYIDAPMTATVFTDDPKRKPNRDIVTAELIYYWMIACQIPFECQKWHLNRLLTLIRVCEIKNAPPKKMSKGDTLRQYASLNAARLAQMNTKG